MKILLVIPPCTYDKKEHCFIAFPLGMAYLAAVLMKSNEVEVLDCLIEDPKPKNFSKEEYMIGLGWAEIKDRIKKSNPDIVGISCSYTSQYAYCVKLASLVKEVNNKTVNVIGGAHPSAMPKEVLENPHIDFVILGEGEHTFTSLIKSLEYKKNIANINGIGYKKGSHILINKKKDYIQDLDKLPFPARHLFNVEKYFKYGKEHAFYSKAKPSTTLITSRGCTGKCVYCSVHSVFGSVWRARSPSNVEKELEYLKEKYHIKEVHFEDDNLTLDRKRMITICNEMIQKELQLSWTTPNGVSINHLDEELIVKMKQSGCYRLFIGVESGSPRVLEKVIKKDLSLKKTEEIIRLLKKYDISVVGFFIMGLPGESKEDIKKTLRFITSNDFYDISVAIASPYPGTELYMKCKKEGLIKNNDFSKFNPYHAVISIKELDCKELSKLRNEACLRFQLSKMSKNPLRFFTDKHNYATFLRYLSFL